MGVPPVMDEGLGQPTTSAPGTRRSLAGQAVASFRSRSSPVEQRSVHGDGRAWAEVPMVGVPKNHEAWIRPSVKNFSRKVKIFLTRSEKKNRARDKVRRWVRKPGSMSQFNAVEAILFV